MQTKIIQLSYTVLFLLFALQSSATSHIDSLIQEVEHMDNSIGKVLVLIEISDSLVSIETIQSLRFAQKALSVAKKINSKKGIGLAYYQIAKTDYYRDEYASALDNCEDAIKAFAAIGEQIELAKTYFLKGNIYSYQENSTQATRFLNKALNIFSQKKATLWKADTYASLGMIYNKKNENDSALIYLNQAINIYTASKKFDDKKLLRAYILKGIALNDQKKYDDAIAIYLKALDLAKKIDFTYNIHVCKTNLGWTYQIIGDYQKAKTYCSEALESAEEMNDLHSITANNRCLGLVYFKLKQYSEAKVYLENGLQIATESNLTDAASNFYKYIISLYEAQGDYKNALKFQKEFQIFSDTVQSKTYETQKETDRLAYKTSENMLNKELEATKEKVSNWKIFGGLVIFLLLVGIGGLIFLLAKQRNSFNKKNQITLQNHNAAINSVKEELEKFTYAASHDLKEPVRNIMSFSGLLHKRLSKKYQDEELSEYVGFIIKGARQMYDTLVGILEFSSVNTFPTQLTQVNINQVIHSTFISLEVLMHEKNGVVSFNTELPESILTNESYIRLIFKNLIENGIIYNNSEVPTVKINYESLTDYHLFKISDNGIGVNEAYHDYIFDMFKRLHARQDYHGTGMGLAIVKKLVEALNGTIRIEKTSEEGSTFIFSLPKH